MKQRRALLKFAAAGIGTGLLRHGHAQGSTAWPPAGGVRAVSPFPAPASGTALSQRIGVLLPKSSGPLQRAAAAVRAGIEEAYRREGRDLVVDIYELDDTASQISAAYRGMLERGTTFVLGPMTRDGVAALASIGDVPVTTLALNQIDAGTLLPPNVLSYNLSTEFEARQMADEALRLVGPAGALDHAGGGGDGGIASTGVSNGNSHARRAGGSTRSTRAASASTTSQSRGPGAAPRAIVVAGPSQAAKRGAAAFAARWKELGAEVAAALDLAPAGLYKFRPIARRQSGDLYFLSMDTDLAIPVRTIIGDRLPVFGTSMMSLGGPDNPARAPELDGVRVLDMPAVLIPSYVSRVGYAAAPSTYPTQLQRLYAMGIDAMRIARTLNEGGATFEFNGLTGRLRFDGTTPQVSRTALLAQYQDGTPIAV